MYVCIYIYVRFSHDVSVFVKIDGQIRLDQIRSEQQIRLGNIQIQIDRQTDRQIDTDMDTGIDTDPNTDTVDTIKIQNDIDMDQIQYIYIINSL